MLPTARAVVVASAVAPFGMCAVAAGSGQTAGWQISPSALESPAKAESAQPQLTVSKRGVLLSWIERTGPEATLKFSSAPPTGGPPPSLWRRAVIGS